MREGVGVVYQGTLFGRRPLAGPPRLPRARRAPERPRPLELRARGRQARPDGSRRRRSCSSASTPTACRPCRGGRPSESTSSPATGPSTPTAWPTTAPTTARSSSASRSASSETTTRPETYPDPVDHCRVCRWWPRASTAADEDDHLCRVAGISRLQTKRLVAAAVPTLTALATLPAGERKPELAPRTLRPAPRAGAPAAGAVPRRPGPLRAHPAGPRGARPGAGRPARALARRRLPRLRVRPLGHRGRARVPDRHRGRGRAASPSTPPSGPTRPRRRSGPSSGLIDSIVAGPRGAPGRCTSTTTAPTSRGPSSASWAATPRARTRWTASCAAACSSTSTGSSATACACPRSRTRSRRSRSSTCRGGRGRRPGRASPSSSTRGGWRAATPASSTDLAAYNRDDCVSIWKLRAWLEGLRKEAEATFERRARSPGAQARRADREAGRPARGDAGPRRGADRRRPGRPRRAHGRAARPLDPRPAPRLAPPRGQARMVAPLHLERGPGRGAHRVDRCPRGPPVRARGGDGQAVDPLPLPLRPRAGAQVPRGRHTPRSRDRQARGHACTPWTPPPARSTWPGATGATRLTPPPSSPRSRSGRGCCETRSAAWPTPFSSTAWTAEARTAPRATCSCAARRDSVTSHPAPRWPRPARTPSPPPSGSPWR